MSTKRLLCVPCLNFFVYSVTCTANVTHLCYFDIVTDDADDDDDDDDDDAMYSYLSGPDNRHWTPEAVLRWTPETLRY